ncbi:hypothetical protein BKA70DRAFT_1419241 [Coprinopsis sp. MPI-PUGE-AT-0042]|nr:hypothetical protein BKA70DRAFT_1419241 [Coprinopsis sp. MPI-PUGE-AT-0042]
MSFPRPSSTPSSIEVNSVGRRDGPTDDGQAAMSMLMMPSPPKGGEFHRGYEESLMGSIQSGGSHPTWLKEAGSILPRFEHPMPDLPMGEDGLPTWPPIDLQHTTNAQIAAIVKRYTDAVWFHAVPQSVCNPCFPATEFADDPHMFLDTRMFKIPTSLPPATLDDNWKLARFFEEASRAGAPFHFRLAVEITKNRRPVAGDDGAGAAAGKEAYLARALEVQDPELELPPNTEGDDDAAQPTPVSKPTVGGVQSPPVDKTAIDMAQTPPVDKPAIAAVQPPPVDKPTVDAVQPPPVDKTTIDTVQTPPVDKPTADAVQSPPVEKAVAHALEPPPVEKVTVDVVQSPPVDKTAIDTVQTPPVDKPTADAVQPPPVEKAVAHALEPPPVEKVTVDAVQSPPVDKPAVDAAQPLPVNKAIDGVQMPSPANMSHPFPGMGGLDALVAAAAAAAAAAATEAAAPTTLAHHLGTGFAPIPLVRSPSHSTAGLDTLVTAAAALSPSHLPITLDLPANATKPTMGETHQPHRQTRSSLRAVLAGKGSLSSSESNGLPAQEEGDQPTGSKRKRPKYYWECPLTGRHIENDDLPNNARQAKKPKRASSAYKENAVQGSKGSKGRGKKPKKQ